MEKLRALSTSTLKSFLKDRGLSQGCRVKEDLVQRLYEAIVSETEEQGGVYSFVDCLSETLSSEAEISDCTVSEDETTIVERNRELLGTGSKVLKEKPKSEEIRSAKKVACETDVIIERKMPDNNILFRDVEDSLETYSGESNKNLEVWLKDFEDISTACSWNEVHKYLYARRLLRGAAKLAVESSQGLHNWKQLKDFLTSEFITSRSGISVHRALEKRKKRSDETFLEYLYTMKGISSQGNIDEKSLIQYIVEGIQDEVSNKAILYEAGTLTELKQKIKVYETMNAHRTSKKYETNSKSLPSRNKEATSPKERCANCGSLTHPSKDCPHRPKGARCFNCGEFGHIAPKCNQPKKTRDDSRNARVNVVSIPDLHINACIRGKSYLALVDTGSDVTLVRESVCKRNSPNQDAVGPSICLSGFGRQVRRTLGSFLMDINICNDDYRIRCHVVPDPWLSQDILIGKDLLKDATLTVENGKATLKKTSSSAMEAEEEENFLEKIDVVRLIEEYKIDSIEEISNITIRKKVKDLVHEYKPNRPAKSKIEMTICLEEDTPVYQKPRRLAPKEKEIVNQQIQQWLDEEIVRPSSSSYASPIVLAKKKDGTSRLCVDYRLLNKKIIKDRYPLPVIEDVLESLFEAHVFTTLDLRNGFFHVDVNEESRKYTSFVTPEGQYEFMKVPFGLCNSPAVFQRYVNTIFQPLIRNKVILVYMDDIIIPSSTEEENVEKLQKTLSIAKEHGLMIKWSKCKFLKHSIEFLGHIIEAGNIKPSEEKIRAVKGFPVPKNVKQLQSFLGLTGFFRKFVAEYSTIAKPLTDLTKKSAPFVFGAKEQDSFHLLKEKLCSEPVLRLFNPSLETELHTDASKEGYGGVLLQRSLHDRQFHPVYYLSFKTTKAEKNYSSYELEVLAIVKSLKKLRPFLLGLPFKVITDCKAFQLTMKKRDLSSRVARWALLLEEYRSVVQHRSGSALRHVDALSRYPTVCAIENGLLQQIRKAQEKDESCRVIAELLREREFEGYVNRNEILYKFVDGTYLLVVPKVLQKEIIKNIHDQGHINSRKVEALAKQDYFVPSLSKKVETVIANCVTCILASRKQGKPECHFNPIEKIDLPLHTYHIDHLGPLKSTSKNYNHLFVVIDAFTKFSWLYPVKGKSSEEVIRKLELQADVFGNPHRIISDRGTAFSSSLFDEYCAERNINHVLTTTGVPRGNGQVERLNQTIISVLTKLSLESPEKWFKNVPHLQRILNSTASRATGKTPFELMVGVKMNRTEDLKLAKIIEDKLIEEFDDRRQELREQAKQAIVRIQEENRKYTNRKRKAARTYYLKDLVALKKTQFAPGAKLHPKYMGPYEITKVKGNDRYDLRRVGGQDGPYLTCSAADHLKPWRREESDDSSGTDDTQDGRLWDQSVRSPSTKAEIGGSTAALCR